MSTYDILTKLLNNFTGSDVSNSINSILLYTIPNTTSTFFTVGTISGSTGTTISQSLSRSPITLAFDNFGNIWNADVKIWSNPITRFTDQGTSVPSHILPQDSVNSKFILSQNKLWILYNSDTDTYKVLYNPIHSKMFHDWYNNQSQQVRTNDNIFNIYCNLTSKPENKGNMQYGDDSCNCLNTQECIDQILGGGDWSGKPVSTSIGRKCGCSSISSCTHTQPQYSFMNTFLKDVNNVPGSSTCNTSKQSICNTIQDNHINNNSTQQQCQGVTNNHYKCLNGQCVPDPTGTGFLNDSTCANTCTISNLTKFINFFKSPLGISITVIFFVTVVSVIIYLYYKPVYNP